MTIEERIQDLRKCKGLSQEQLADILGVSRQAVSKWESGQSMPEVEKLIAISELFGVSVDYILKGDTPMPPVQDNNRHDAKIVSQVFSAVAFMVLLVGVIACFSNGDITMDIYGGLIIESAGIMLLLVGCSFTGFRAINKPLFVIDILLAGILPSIFIIQTLLQLKPSQMPPLSPTTILLFFGAYLLMCGTSIYFAVIRKNAQK